MLEIAFLQFFTLMMENLWGQFKNVWEGTHTYTHTQSWQAITHKPSIAQNCPLLPLSWTTLDADHLLLLHGYIATYSGFLESTPLLFALLSGSLPHPPRASLRVSRCGCGDGRLAPPITKNEWEGLVTEGLGLEHIWPGTVSDPFVLYKFCVVYFKKLYKYLVYSRGTVLPAGK